MIQNGGLGDPVAQSINAEQTRDSVPTADEMERERKDFLRSNGCCNCGCSDVEKLSMTALPQPELAQPDPRPDVVVCEDCKEGVVREAQEKADKRDEAEREWREKRRQ